MNNKFANILSGNWGNKKVVESVVTDILALPRRDHEMLECLHFAAKTLRDRSLSHYGDMVCQAFRTCMIEEPEPKNKTRYAMALIHLSGLSGLSVEQKKTNLEMVEAAVPQVFTDYMNAKSEAAKKQSTQEAAPHNPASLISLVGCTANACSRV